MKKILITSGILFALPLLAGAQGLQRDLLDIFGLIRTAINIAIPLMISAAVLVLLYGILYFILKAHEDKAREKARQTIFLGLIGIFVMVSVWGLVNILVNTLNLDKSAPNDRIENLVDLPYGDFGDSLEGAEECAAQSRVENRNYYYWGGHSPSCVLLSECRNAGRVGTSGGYCDTCPSGTVPNSAGTQCVND